MVPFDKIPATLKDTIDNIPHGLYTQNLMHCENLPDDACVTSRCREILLCNEENQNISAVNHDNRQAFWSSDASHTQGKRHRHPSGHRQIYQC